VKLANLAAAVAFLTILPLGSRRGTLTDAAAGMPFFPLIGGFIGLASGAFAVAVSFIFPNLLVGLLTVAFLLFLTGLHHMDGLLDFGDGLMHMGGPSEKIAAMRDTRTGVAGWALGTLVVLVTAAAVGALNFSQLLPVLISAEAAAKFSMVLLGWSGRLADKGTATPFIAAMRGSRCHLRLVSALAITLVIVVVLTATAGLIAFIGGLAATLLVAALAHRNFGGLTGDVFGAGNELTRAGFLLVFVGIGPWA